MKKSNEISTNCVVSACIRTTETKLDSRFTLRRRKTGGKRVPYSDYETEGSIELGEGKRMFNLERYMKAGNSGRGSSSLKDTILCKEQNDTLDITSVQGTSKLLQTKSMGSASLASLKEFSMKQKGMDIKSILKNKIPASTNHTSIGKGEENHTKSSVWTGAEVSCKSENLNRQAVKRGGLDRIKTSISEGIKSAAVTQGHHQEIKDSANVSVKTMASSFQIKTVMDSGSNTSRYLTNTIVDNGDRKPPRSGGGTIGKEEMPTQKSSAGNELWNGEDSVTVAVRVRPFSNREKRENARQVIFMSGQETVVQHPETNQIYAFVYDFSFWSFDELHPEFSSQESVYKIVGSPLLEKAFQGYNACLFAYGQTGSGKSYTMMGFGDEGIIPRFCQQLFASVANPEMQQVTYHIEMSYFEVYNERIHDLLTATSGKAQVKQSLRIREHPVYGPYVADLSSYVVSSYFDIQGWLELGNKQRATAATGMNEKSSRSHSVFTLVMTQTKTEFVEEEEHEHSVTSRVNLVDLAGSERCFTAQTSGERLKEGVSINKSLFTLGKVICALSEQSQSKKKIFVPYRESVLTWLLKDSIGGNSKTAMIATVSPSASNVEETLSTLRYAKRARQIINIAKVNEDSNAKLIRDLKAEIENLRAAQMSSQGIQSEKYKVSQKEIGALKLKLSQQEREMAEVQRRWREKLDQAEKRKLEEARELQKAGITFKVDNSLPNLVNLNEDPQISEMLLYMIKEGRTRVGKHKPNSTHDIQLSGALIADDHCIIQNLNSTVMIAPIGDAKTYVNGNLITDSTVLHHGDRVILGGDHYFKFNHPVEVQSGRRASCANALLRDGPKDFEFAKNELLQAQQARLEAEIEEAQLQAKREMMQGIQVAKEMAQKELSSQKSLYENKIKDLEKELEKEACKKKLQELNTKKAVSKMEELQDAKRQLEQKVELNRKRLQMETLAAKQALKDHNIHHAKFLAALEAEKRKMTEDLQKIQKERNKRLQTKSCVTYKNSSDWSSMKLSMMIQEANTISKNLRKCTVFSRHEESDKENISTPQTPIQVQVRNTKLGISTYWSLEKFEWKVTAMRELYQGSAFSKDEDLFYDPNDDWEADVTSCSLSRRLSKSFFRSKRMSGCLSEIRNTPLQNLQSAHPTDLLNISRSICSAGAQSSLPAVCKELLGAAVDYLGRNHLSQETIPDRLLADLLTIQTSTCAIANAYEQLDDESQENLFTNNTEMQSHCIKITTNLERVAILMKLWVDKALPQGTCSEITDDELLGEVKTLGRNLQLLLKGCDSDISSMVTEAQNRISQTIRRVMKHVGHLATFTGVALHFEEQNLEDSLSYKQTAAASLYEGGKAGMKSLLDNGLKRAKQEQKLLQRTTAKMECFEELKKNNMVLMVSVQNYLTEYNKMLGTLTQESADSTINLSKASAVAAELIKFNGNVQQINQLVVSVLRGEHVADQQLMKCIEMICSSAKYVTDNFCALCPFSDEVNMSSARENKLDMKGLQLVANALESAATSLLDVIHHLQSEKGRSSTRAESFEKKKQENIKTTRAIVGHGTCRDRGVKKTVYTLQGPMSEDSSPRGVQWV
eukprot:gi/632940791/ref/XP_007885506.1/ PREDICTED: kinesin-like protein KIF14 isoform X2 [Callorhinchus milii]